MRRVLGEASVKESTVSKGGLGWVGLGEGTDNESNLTMSACEYEAPTTMFESRPGPAGVVTLLLGVLR